jgi:secondary thiamine-phosphate synthase enzyme
MPAAGTAREPTMKTHAFPLANAVPLLSQLESPRLCAWSHQVEFRSPGPMAFVDLTDRLRDCVARSGVDHGLLNLQCLHTSAALLINEDEPLLLEDFRALLERFAPRDASWQHDRFDVRTVNMTPEERPNGHAHARALVLRSSECLNVVDGCLALGRWQRVFFLECDEARDRAVSLLVLGAGRPQSSGAPRGATAPCA